jgi:membrane-associated phospholipid phosphatase
MRARIAPAFALLAVALGARVSRAATWDARDSTAAARPALYDPARREPAPLLGRGDVLFALAAVSAVAIVAPQDEWLAGESDEVRAPAGGTIARSAQPFGNGAYVLPALAASWLVARATGRTQTAGAIVRIGVSVCAAGAGALAIKEIVGRPRPDESHDSDDLYPFSGHASFPSGHATIAFALATAIDRESSWWGTPWITYPLATVVGWSRVHDDQHWTSDVVAGAALGMWTAHKVEDVLQPSSNPSPRVRLGIRWLRSGPAMALTLGR